MMCFGASCLSGCRSSFVSQECQVETNFDVGLGSASPLCSFSSRITMSRHSRGCQALCDHYMCRHGFTKNPTPNQAGCSNTLLHSRENETHLQIMQHVKHTQPSLLHMGLANIHLNRQKKVFLPFLVFRINDGFLFPTAAAHT